MYTKQIIKKASYIVLGKTISNLSVDNIEMADIISMDVFDTLIFRNCLSPDSIFKIVEYKCQKRGMSNVPFYDIRIEAEHKAREEKTNGEVNLRGIYDKMSELSDSEKKELYELEIETEIEYCILNDEMKDVFDLCKTKGKTIVLTSDMYLPRDTINCMLQKCGITGYSDVFLSCQRNATKRKGDLFDILLTDVNVKAGKVLHIGDNLKADYLVPRRKGIKTFLYKRYKSPIILKNNHLMFEGTENKLQYNIITGISNNCLKRNDIYFDAGALILGPMVLGYCMWLYCNLKKNDCKNVIFLAREGRILKSAYDTLYGEDDIISTYANVSRLSLCRASVINAKNYEMLGELFACFSSRISNVSDFYWLVVGKQYESIELDSDLRLDQLDTVQKKKLFDIIVVDNWAYFEEQNKLLLLYLTKLGFDSDKIAIADIGWSGTMQLKLQKLFPTKEITGYYMAVSDANSSEYASIIRKGYYCNSDEWKTKGQSLRFTLSAVETLFMSEEGSTMAYEMVAGNVIPIKREDTWDKKSLGIIQSLNKGVIEFCKRCAAVRLNGLFDMLDPNCCFDAYMQFTVFPSRMTVDFFRSLEFEDATINVGFVPLHSFTYYLFHVNEMKKELENNNSKIIWLKGLCRIPFPYYWLLMFLTGKLGLKSENSKKQII